MKIRGCIKIDLIIKPTQACNFRCDFCSSTNIVSNNAETLPLENIFNFLKYNQVNSIIVNGGDPLMMPPKYYHDILDFIDRNNMKTTLSFTSNLWDFYLYPNKWIPLFQRHNMKVCTSFQYGNQRKLADGRVYTEELFKEVFNKFYYLFNKRLMFISTTSEENEDKVIDTVKLAKQLQTKCKINPIVFSGRSTSSYPYYKMIAHYFDIIESELYKYEITSNELVKISNDNDHTICPFNRKCHFNIRCIGPNSIMHSCGTINDLHEYHKTNNMKTYCLSGDTITYSENELANDYNFLTKKCFACNMFIICNSCRHRIYDIINHGNVEEHCTHMKKLEERWNNICKRKYIYK